MTCIVRERQLRHYGHVAHFPEVDPARKILIVGDPSGWTRPRGRPHKSWLRQMEGYFHRVGLDWGDWSARAVANRDPKLFCCVSLADSWLSSLDALLADLETTTSHIAKRPVLLSDPLLGPQAVSSDTGLGQVYSNGTENDVRPLPPAYTPQQTVSTAMKSGPLPQVKDAERLYSTVCKPKSPKTKEQMGLSSSSVLGGGLSELDHLLQELNATQFNITDEILAQFPSSKTDEAEKLKQFQASVINSPRSKDETAAASSGSGSGQSLKPSATAATLELDKLMASLSDFKVQTNDSPPPSSSAPAMTQPRPTAPPPPQSSGSLDSMLGLLQSDLTRQGIPTTAKGTCAACQKPIVSQVVTALGQTWHPEHFVCTHCQKEIGASNFFEKDGLPYCEEDYFMLFSPRCGLCNQPILDVSLLLDLGLRALMECRYKYLFAAFVDFRKTFDSVGRAALWDILRVCRITSRLLDIMAGLSTGAVSAVQRGGRTSVFFPVDFGVHQCWFCSYSVQCLYGLAGGQVVGSSGCVASVGEERFTDLDFADHAAIFMESMEVLIGGLERLREESEGLG
ncbi:TGFI1 protein, partial [Polypterus senegalus]